MTIQLTVSRIIDTDSVKQVITDIAENSAIAGAVRQVKVHGTNYEKVEGKKKRKAHPSAVDLISHDLIYEEPILAYGQNKRTLDDASAYATLDEVYSLHKETLESASHIE